MKTLIVSDDPVFARLVSKKLESWGHRTSVASTGTEAYERIKKEPFRVVITGSNIPGISGSELCRRIRALQHVRYTYVIIYGNSERASQTPELNNHSMMVGLQAGADNYLILPWNPLELRLRLKNAMRRLNLEDELREGPGIDWTTGVVNEASFRQFFRVILAETRQSKRRGALMFVQIDDYHEKLAEHGYDPMQRMMVDVANILNRSTRDYDLVGKMSDDEFCLLLQDTYWARCAPVAEKIVKEIESVSVVVDNQSLRPQVRIYTINYPDGALSSDDILARPDRIPYAAQSVHTADLAHRRHTATDLCMELVARRRETLDRINQSKDSSDEEIVALYNRLFDPIERELMDILPTTKVGILAVLDEVLFELRRNDPEAGWGNDFVMALVENARSAIASSIQGPDDHRTLSTEIPQMAPASC